MELSQLIDNYVKSNDIKIQSEEYVHTYADGSKETFTIETADRDITLFDKDDREWYDVNVPTKQLTVNVRTDMCPRLDWFQGKRFRTVNSAIKAIQKDVKGK